MGLMSPVMVLRHVTSLSWLLCH